MTKETTEINKIPDFKIYKDKAITTGTYLGGPLIAGYFMASNFKAFNEPDKAKKAWAYSILFTIILFGSPFLIPSIDKVPKYIIPLTYTGIVYFFIKGYQIEKINSHIATGGQVYSWSRVIGLSLAGAVITFLPVFLMVFFYYYSTSDLVVKNYGLLNNEVSYSKKNISDPEIDKVADALTKTTFFDDVKTKYVHVKKVSSTYEIHISVDKNSLNNPEVTQIFKDFRNELQTYFPSNKVVIVYITDSIDNVIGRVE